ncbi:ABC transporter permease [candidate division KSB1 bacterium]|nr:ABC transporter permease [candidate division KSB1 bacterium]
MFINYIKTAFRNIRRNRMFTVINMSGLAIGMACFILIFMWVRDELSFDEFHNNKNELYQLTITHPNGSEDPNVPYALAPVMANEFPEIQSYSRIFKICNLTTCSFKYLREDGQQIMFYEDNVDLVDPGFFSMFTFPFKYGSPETALQDRFSIVISEVMAVKYFGEEEPVGKKLTFNNSQDLIVSAVVQIPANSHLQFDFIAGLSNNMMNDWNWRDPSYVLLDKNADVREFRHKITDALNRYYPGQLPGTFKVDILPVTKVHLHFGGMTYVYIFSLIGLFILFLACVNYINLSTACSNIRAREVLMRKVVGAGRKQLILQFLGESTLLSTMALMLALVLVKLFLPLLNILTSKELILSTLFDNIFMVIFLFGFIVFVGVLSGSYPAIYLTSSHPINILRVTFSFKSNRSLFRISSVVGQFTISILLIICTIVVYKQLHYVQNRPLGFKTDYIVNIPINIPVIQSFDSYKLELLKNPNILNVTANQAKPYDEDYKTSGVDWNQKDPQLVPNIRYSITQFDYLETFEMNIKEGRAFSKEFPADITNYVINEEAVRYMNLKNPVGERISFWGREGEIIGVVQDFHHVSLHRKILPHIFTVNPQFYGALKNISVKLNSENIPETIKYIQHVTKTFAPNFPFEYSFLDSGIDNLYKAEQKLGTIFSYFWILAIFISCMGIFGLAAFVTEQRYQEIGVRKVLGASVKNIIYYLNKEYMKWVLIANFIAWPIAWFAMNKWLQNFAYRVNMSWWIFFLSGGIVFVIALATVSLRIIRAATANPVDALRYE